MLEDCINKEVGMWVVMMCNGDYYILFNKCLEVVCQYKVDLLIFIYVDVFMQFEFRGGLVWVLFMCCVDSELGCWLEKIE